MLNPTRQYAAGFHIHIYTGVYPNVKISKVSKLEIRFFVIFAFESFKKKKKIPLKSAFISV